MTEDWRDVPGFEGYYAVSDRGRFRSLDRIVEFSDGRRRLYAGRPLKLKLGNDGYFLVSLSRGVEDKKWHLAHRHVASAFIGPCPEGCQVRHKDGVRTNIEAANLHYGTAGQNRVDQILHGTMPCGEEHHSAHVLESAVAAIRAERGLTISEIATKHGVSRTHAWNVRNGKRRNSLTEALKL